MHNLSTDNRDNFWKAVMLNSFQKPQYLQSILISSNLPHFPTPFRINRFIQIFFQCIM